MASHFCYSHSIWESHLSLPSGNWCPWPVTPTPRRIQTWRKLHVFNSIIYSSSSQFKIRSLTSHTCNYAFCNQIQALKLESYPAPCDKKSHLKHRTLFLSHVRGSGVSEPRTLNTGTLLRGRFSISLFVASLGYNFAQCSRFQQIQLLVSY